jgi:hypothetical protein
MLKLSGFRHNHHPSGVKMLAKFIRRGIRVKITCVLPIAHQLIYNSGLDEQK